MDNKKWIYYRADHHKLRQISRKFNISSLVAAVILNRGIQEPEEISMFLEKDIAKVYDPFLMKDMTKAVQRIKKAICEQEKMTVYGDYDVDGVTSTAILVKYLDGCGAHVDYYIPDRMDEGYGVNKQALQRLYENGTKLVITVDAGITAVEEVEFAKGLGLDFIITDHHECKEEIPKAYAIVNPKQQDCPYPFKELAGVGVVFKLIQGLAGKAQLGKVINDYCDIVCLGTVADVVPLLGENRLIVDHGLKLMKNTDHLGLKALVKVSGLDNAKIGTGAVGFMIAPRINAAGRIGSALRAAALFLTDDQKTAYEIARELNEENKKRQATEAQILDEAMRMIEQDFDLARQKVIVLYGEDWHHGVIGVVASRITDKFHRPSILIALEGDEGKGSGRSIRGFNLFEALTTCRDTLIKFGGHELAAGLTIDKKEISAFIEHIGEYADSHLCEDALIPRIYIDCQIQAVDLTFDTVKQLEILEPFGMRNAGPVFSLCDAVISDIRVVGEGKHLKMRLEKDKIFVDAVGFNMGDYEKRFIAGDVVDVACTLGINSYQGKDKIQLTLKDIKMSGAKRMEYKYYKTFDACIRNDIINSITKDVDICFKQDIEIRDVLGTLEDEHPVLMIVNTLAGAAEIIDQLEREFEQQSHDPLSQKPYSIYFNTLGDDNHALDILINPVMGAGQIQNYSKVYIYDPCFSIAFYCDILKKNNNVYLLFDNTKYRWCEHVLDQIIPVRQDFVIVYQYIKTRSVQGIYEDDVFVLTRRIAISYHVPMNYLKLKHCLDIFRELGLLCFSICNEQIRIQLNDNKSKKVNIESSVQLAKLRKLREKCEETKKFLNQSS